MGRRSQSVTGITQAGQADQKETRMGGETPASSRLGLVSSYFP